MSASRMFAQRSSALRSLSRQSLTRHTAFPGAAAKRSYASAHGEAQKSSDLPWLIGSVTVTVPALAYLISNGPKRSASHGPKAGEKHGASEGTRAKGEDTPPKDHPDNNDQANGEGGDDSRGGGKDPQAPGKASMSGQNVPPPSADNRDLAEKWDEAKEGHEQYKETIEAKQTRTASSSSEMPSKKTATEDPREDPQKGEGEGAQKGSSK
ncbi:hypothetical protein F5Y19DRAFT_59858 [Xylariaceae sp. FL1651]|nr:hypothetical protein F5Y19DRAFT_59858 [Xylariaceae sp. FL1651]